MMKKLGEAGTAGEKAGLQRPNRQMPKVKVAQRSASFPESGN
jgi:hypothetical protein